MIKLDEKYDAEKFHDFIRGFLPTDYKEKEEDIIITERYKVIKKAKILGFCESLDLYVLEMDHARERDPRVAITSDAFKILADHWIHNALVVFKNDDSKNYRFSYLTIKLESDDGKKVKQKYSNARRYSFYLGPDAKTKTAESFLIGKGKIKDANDLLDRFNVEIVTKEFYQNYKKLFEKLLDHLKKDKAFDAFANKHGLKLEIFAKKLLGQIVFIYFLQKKGWLGAKKGEYISNGDRFFLRNLFKNCQKENQSFFNDYLEYLFYDCLNRQPAKAGTFYREKFDCQIPFLNGGLFEPVNDYNWQQEYIHIPNEIFSNSKDGILDIFDLYNFTIDENTPDDQEVSVDPEMLGKVFENLLEDNIRKGQGAFYTPREIVHYMCQESLINYLDSNSKIGRKIAEDYVKYLDSKEDLKTISGWEGEVSEIDKLLQEIKVCDPACGSGAFLVGMLNEIIKLRFLLRMLNPGLSQMSVYDLKKETIQNSLYGVDLDPGAIDIAKLRFWLSIVVDENIEDIEPLPNLDYKIMQGNSLLEDLVIGDSMIKFNFDGKKRIDRRSKEQKQLFETGGIQGKLILEESDTLADKMEKYHTEYFNITDPDKKKILKKKIDSIEDELIQSKCQEEIRNAETFIQNNQTDSKKILKNTEKVLAVKGVLNKWKEDRLRPFFPWKLHFGEVFNRENGGFDIVIANPPYLSSKNIENKIKPFYEKIYKTPTAHYDIYVIFFEQGLNLLRNNGVLNYITSNKYFSQKYGDNLRKLLLQNSITDLINFNFKVFQATVDTAITILKKIDPEKNNKVNLLEINEPDIKNGLSLTKILNGSQREKVLQNFIGNLPGTYFRFDIKNSELNIYKKAISSSTKLSRICLVIYGIVLHNAEKGFEKKDFVFESNKNANYKLYTEGKYIDRWFIKKHFYLDYNPLIHREPRYQELFEQNKLIGKRIIGRKGFSFLFDDESVYVDNTLYVVMPYYLLPQNKYSQLKNILTDERIKLSKEINLKYILALINSNFYKWFFQKFYSFGLDVYPAHIKDFPIKIVSSVDQEQFVDLVNEIDKIAKSSNYFDSSEKQAKVKEYEKEIDQMVYKLYDLTPEEIEIVENSSKK